MEAVRIFETKDNKAPLGKWKDTKTEISFKDIFDKNLPNWRNIAVIVPKGYSVYDFDTPKGVDITFYKQQVVKYLKMIFGEEFNNLTVETDKGIHLWVKGIIPQTAGFINRFGLFYDIRSNEDGYVIIKRKGKIRPIYGNEKTWIWKTTKRIILGVSKTSLNEKETKLFEDLWAKKDFNGQRNNTMFSVYRAFLIRHFKLRNPESRTKTGIFFNQLWEWDLTDQEISIIMQTRDTDKKINREVLATPTMSVTEAAYPFELKFNKKENKYIPVERKGMVAINMRKALRYFIEEYGPRIMKLDDKALIFVNNDGFWIKDLEDQLLFLKKWFLDKFEVCVSTADIKELHSFISIKAKNLPYNAFEFAYLLGDNKKVLVRDCEIEDFDIEKHQVMIKMAGFKLIDKNKIKKKEVQKIIKYLYGIIEEPEKNVGRLLAHIRYLFMPHKKARKTLILIGRPHSGKSTFIQFINKGFGKSTSLVKNISLTKLINSQFGAIELQGAIMVYDDDVAGFFDKANLGLFKTIISSEQLRMEKKFSNSFNDFVTTKLWLCTNDTIKVKSASGIDTRFDFIRFKQIAKDKRDTNILDKFNRDTIHHFFNYLIYHFESGKSVNLLVENFNHEKWRFLFQNNSVFAFHDSINNGSAPLLTDCKNFEEYYYFMFDDPTLNYEAYKEWCKDSNYKPVSLGTFNSELTRFKEEYYEEWANFLNEQKNGKDRKMI